MNIVEDEYYTPILLSVPATGEGAPTFLAALVDRLCEKTNGDPAPFLIIHAPAVALATATAGDRRALIDSLAGWIKAGRLTVWNAGYAGAAVDLLNDEEFSREREWATANPWKYGFGMLSGKTGGGTAFAASGTEVPGPAEGSRPEVATRNAVQLLSVPRYFPLRLRIDQARKLRDGTEAVCLGYASPPGPGMVSELVIDAGTGSAGHGNISAVRARYLMLDPAFAAAGPGKGDDKRDDSGVSYSSSDTAAVTTDDPVDVNHVVLPRGIADAA
ncbi:MAG: hypothetical protein PF508_04780, partial [Spirochaeta sp.]|nr:hypothetical protein [Spirochaeta sp.]